MWRAILSLRPQKQDQSRSQEIGDRPLVTFEAFDPLGDVFEAIEQVAVANRAGAVVVRAMDTLKSSRCG
jgi:hypothetical protein